MVSIKIPKIEDGSRIDRCIRRILGNINQGILEKYLRSGLILLENKKIKSSVKVSFGQLIEYSSQIDFENKKNKEYTNEDKKMYYKNLYKKIFITQTTPRVCRIIRPRNETLTCWPAPGPRICFLRV